MNLLLQRWDIIPIIKPKEMNKMDNTNRIFVRINGDVTELAVDDYYILIENYLDKKNRILSIDDVFDYFLNTEDFMFFGDEELIEKIANELVDSHNDEIRADIDFEREQRYQDSIIPSAYTRKSDDMTDYEYQRMVGYDPTR